MSNIHPYGGGETEGMTGTSKGSSGAIGDERTAEPTDDIAIEGDLTDEAPLERGPGG